MAMGKCVHCGAAAGVFDSRSKPGLVVRKYRCEGAAAHIFTTREEVSDPEIERVSQKNVARAKNVERARSMLTRALEQLEPA